MSLRQFGAETRYEGVLVAKFVGNADAATKPTLDSFLADLHDEARRLQVTRVVLDFTEFEFMSSAGFKSFVAYLTTLQEDSIYRVSVLSSDDMLWQRRSLHALKCFAPDLLDVDEVKSTKEAP